MNEFQAKAVSQIKRLAAELKLPVLVNPEGHLGELCEDLNKNNE